MAEIFKESSFSNILIGALFILGIAYLGGQSPGETTSNGNGIKHDENKSHLETAIVNRIVDGDTLQVEMHDETKKGNGFKGNTKVETIRLLLIDTPESVKQGVDPQPYSIEASNYMKERLTKGAIVKIEKGNPERDKYGRLLAYVWIDGENINKTLLQEGYARVAYVDEPNTKYLDEFRAAEQTAKDLKLKVWSINGYVSNKGFIN